MVSTHLFRLSVIFLAAMPSFVFGQQEIELTNASFEGPAMHSTTPYGWEDCGFPQESPPDIQPGAFEVVTPAQDKRTYLGLVTRENDTWEKVSQKLGMAMKSDECYDFSMYLMRADKYISPSKVSAKDENFNGAVRVRIWGGNSPCHARELLAESGEISNTNWKKYSFKLNPTNNHTYIMIEAHYKKGAFFPYNGNVLLDNLSSLKPCPKPVAAVEPKPKPVNPPVVEPPAPKESEKLANEKPDVEPSVVVKPAETEGAYIPELKDRKKLVKGETIRVNSLQFAADKSDLTEASYPVLNEIYDFLQKNSDVAIEIGGHTNGVPDTEYCDWLSESRAKAVADYLVQKGIEKERVAYKGYGKRQPIATNDTKEGRKKNQRVEIKILEIVEK